MIRKSVILGIITGCLSILMIEGYYHYKYSIVFIDLKSLLIWMFLLLLWLLGALILSFSARFIAASLSLNQRPLLFIIWAVFSFLAVSVVSSVLFLFGSPYILLALSTLFYAPEAQILHRDFTVLAIVGICLCMHIAVLIYVESGKERVGIPQKRKMSRLHKVYCRLLSVVDGIEITYL